MAAEKTLAIKAWISMRFLVFGVGGFILMFISALMLVVFLFVPQGRSFGMSPLLSLPLAVSGSFMMLYGVGEWGRWAYLWVFLSIPLSFSALLMLPSGWSSKDLAMLFPALAAAVSYGFVRRFYRDRSSVEFCTGIHRLSQDVTWNSIDGLKVGDYFGIGLSREA